MMTEKKKATLPELLSPAGSPEALDAAIMGGADAVYFGASLFNARMSAKNFEGDSLKAAIEKCRLYGVKSNITLNTLIHNREIYDLLKSAEELYSLGADALIVADLGAARLIHKYFPDMELHASTQAAGHNLYAARELSKMGFSRMVAARELSFSDLSFLTENSPIETELFIHGAICVSQSGGCLASSLIGGRSGNRGECAQPCRLPYKTKGTRERYPLSLKDICLAAHIPEILSLGAASLKIEGRMKSPDYVFGVTSIYRRLLDERRNATDGELAELRALFSRSGFTDGYFTKKISREMLGVRTDSDKADTSELAKHSTQNYASLKNRGRPLDMHLTVAADKPAKLTARAGGFEVTVYGVIPDEAINRPLTHEIAKRNIEKLGDTPFLPGNIKIDLEDGLIMPLSALNSLRREAVELLSCKLLEKRKRPLPAVIDKPEVSPSAPILTARFDSFSQIPERTGGCEIIYLPLEKFSSEMAGRVNGVIIPPVVFDSETDEVAAMLKDAAEAGIRHALVSNLGHLCLAKEAGMEAHGDFRLNIYNSYTVDALISAGFSDVMASPELTLPQLRDLGVVPVIYGRIPLMTLEKCVIRDLYSCEECEKRSFHPLIDRKGISFPLSRAFKHRNILYNSHPTFMADRKDELVKYRILGGHYIFTDENKEYIEKLLLGKITTPPKGEIRRIGK